MKNEIYVILFESHDLALYAVYICIGYKICHTWILMMQKKEKKKKK